MSSSLTNKIHTSFAQTSLRSGQCTHEETEYVHELIQEFEAGSLNIDEGLSLRRFLSMALNCSPKRISKKFEGTSYNGKQLYKRKASTLTPVQVEERRMKLREMEQKYLESLKVLKLVEASRKPRANAATTAGQHLLLVVLLRLQWLRPSGHPNPLQPPL